MALKPEISVGAGLAVATLVYAIHTNATPTRADIRSLPEGNPDIAAEERKATWQAAGAVAGISLIARDPIIFIIGGTMVIAEAWLTRHANYVNPDAKKYVVGGAVQSAPVSEMETEEYMPSFGAPQADTFAA
jgi:hypothetical protein